MLLKVRVQVDFRRGSVAAQRAYELPAFFSVPLCGIMLVTLFEVVRTRVCQGCSSGFVRTRVSLGTLSGFVRAHVFV
jgi:hypothetical protein